MTVKAIPSSGGVEAAIRRASTSTGVDFDFLMKTARRESAMNPNARAPTSSASGLFQFIEQTWLGTVTRHGAKHGYGQYADLIYQGGDGRWQVRGSARNVVLDLRFDPQAASTMAGELTASNAAYLRGRTGRQWRSDHVIDPIGTTGFRVVHRRGEEDRDRRRLSRDQSARIHSGVAAR